MNSLAVVDLPIPIEPVSPRIRIKVAIVRMISDSEQSLVAQEFQQWQQRQAEHREVVAGDALEQMHAQPLQLIGADTGRDRPSGRIEIRRYLAVAERPHGHGGDSDIGEHYLAVAGYCNG